MSTGGNLNPRKAVAALPCPHCGYAYTKIVYGILKEQGYRRRRVCLKCDKGFITYETPAKEIS